MHFRRNTWEKYFSLWNQNYLISIETQMNTRIVIAHFSLFQIFVSEF